MTAKIEKISVIGAGAWGTALAQASIAAGRDVTLYARDTLLAANILKERENKIYLAGVPLSEKMRATADIQAAVENADLILMVTPVQYMRATLQNLAPYMKAGVPLVNASKGIEITTGYLPSEIAAEILPQNSYAILSGPTFADEVARGQPSAITLATADPNGKQWAKSLGNRIFRIYYSDDVVGVEIAGALKNVVAIACGVVEGMKLGLNARAAVMTRGMAEIRRFGIKRGAKLETFLGLSGIGDLTLTCNSLSSRNFSTGVALGQGQKLSDIMAAKRTVSEGVSTARALAAIAKAENIDMPICAAVDTLLHGDATPQEVLQTLLSRDIRSEGE